ncbi:MAG: ABC transporter ATP-binding protein [Bacteroidota bacterium]
MITIQDLTFRYSKQAVLFEGMNLEIGPGHIHGLLGKNGAGKTTLLKLISGLSFPKSGSVTVDGHVPANREPRLLADIFYVPEEISLPTVTPLKFAEIHGGFYPAYDPGQFHKFLGMFEVDGKQSCARMSYGQRKKTMIAFALAVNTRYLFLDEPAGGLDISSKAALRTMLASSFDADKTIILSTHMVRDLENMIDSVIILENRRIILNQPMEEIACRLRFGHAPFAPASGEVIWSATGELGGPVISLNSSGIPGNADLETLFTACTQRPDQISACFQL